MAMMMPMPMVTSTWKTSLLMALLVVAVLSTTRTTVAQSSSLLPGFYDSTCPDAEKTVRSTIAGLIANDPTIGPALMRLSFHDCFVRGCDASVLLDPSSINPQVEKKAIALRGYDAVNTIKAAVEAICPTVVSCADILAFAARDVTVISGGFPDFAMPAGRRDGTVSKFFEALQNIPATTFNLQKLTTMYNNNGLTADDLVFLMGAHSFGQAHCNFCNGRLYPTVDPTLDPGFAADLQTVCPAPGSGGGNPVINNNRVTDPNTLSNQYFINLQAGKDLFASDQQLMTSTYTAALVANSSADAATWMNNFTASLLKMTSIQVLTGTAGQVRKFCNAVNSS